MKIKFIDNLTLNIYIKKEEINNTSINKVEIEKYLKNVFDKIKKRYNFTIEGFYNVNAYVDKDYGIIFNINKERLEYYDYFNGQIDININVIETKFLYKIDNLPINMIGKFNIVQIDNDVYYKINKELSKKEFMYFIEHIEKIYL